VPAQCGSVKEKEAVFTFTRGQFTYKSRLSEELKNLPPVGSFVGMMMKGLQRIDEQSN